MYLRNILLAISIFIIALSLSLYFQASEEAVPTMSWDQYKSLSYREERSHSLEELNRQIRPFNIEDAIMRAIDRNRMKGQRTRVMEIGAGNGRALMSLKKMFPQVEFYGINKEKTRTFYRRESYALTALKFEIMTQLELEDTTLPYIVFQDLDYGRKIPYDDEKFDVIYSQDTLNYIKYKYELFNEILRVLKTGGVSFHTDYEGVHLYADGVLMENKEAFHKLKRRGMDIIALEDPTSIRFRKTEKTLRFPVTPHQPVPAIKPESSHERQEMNYNLNI